MCEACAGEKSSPTELEKVRFDYAWKWFDFHADQRTKMFNYMLIGMGIFAAASVTAVDKKLELEAAVLMSVAVIVALIFCFIDHRNRQLYIVAMDVLIDMERDLLFAGRTNNEFLDHDNHKKRFGISSRVAWEDKSEGRRKELQDDPVASPRESGYLRSLRGRVTGALDGQHRYWMPGVALTFATLFLAGATRSWLVVAKAVPSVWIFWEGVTVLSVSLVYGLVQWHWRKPRNSPLSPLFFGILGAAAIWAACKVEFLKTPLSFPSAIEVAVGADLNSVIDLRIKEPLGNGQDAHLGALISSRFGPFEQGDDVLNCARHAEAITDTRRALEDARRLGRRVVIVLAGSTDRSRMKPDLQSRYGHDAGLARARISTVEKCLWPAGTSTPSDILRVVGGPAYTPAVSESASAAQRAMREDRFVHVLLVGVQRR